MTKADLKTGMVITCRNAQEFLIMNQVTTQYGVNHPLIGVGINTSGYINVDVYWNDDLSYCDDKQWDIVKVGTVHFPEEIKVLLSGKKHNTIWTRPEKKKYTYAQLKEILGEEFEIVKG